MSKTTEIDYIVQDSYSNQDHCQGVLGLYHTIIDLVTDFSNDVTEHVTDFGNEVSEQAVNLSTMFYETLTSFQERGDDALDDLATNINRYLRPAPTSLVDQSVRSVSDRLDDVSTSIHRSVRDLKYLF